jgi:hypothetical protein
MYVYYIVDLVNREPIQMINLLSEHAVYAIM